ncbi:MAG: DUF6356 family protein [Alphaproteobacteria bacterium]
MSSLIDRLFLEHPRSVGETYTEHLGMAWSFAARMIAGGAACFVHGLLPFLFVTTGSRAVQDLYTRMLTHRARQPGAVTPAPKHGTYADGYFDYVI